MPARRDDDSFPRQQARTQNFSLGAPRSFQVSPDGSRVAFLRSRSGTDPVTCLWVLDLPGAAGAASGPAERLVADPAAIEAAGQSLPEEERARRERARERAAGVVAFATDASCSLAAFALGGRVFAVGLAPGAAPARAVTARSPAIDPRPDPAGRRIAYVSDGALRIADLRTGADRELIGPGSAGDRAEPGDVTYGLAEFVAAEEMGRARGFWWAPDGAALLVARADHSAVPRWHIADPANPERPPARVRYPAAGTPNAAVSLLIVRLDGRAVAVGWDDGSFPYLVAAEWPAGEPLIVVQSRDQRRMRLLSADPATGRTRLLREDTDECWTDIVAGVPARLADGRIAWAAGAGGAMRLFVAPPGELAAAPPVTPACLHVREVLCADAQTVLFTASGQEPADIGVWSWGPAGLSRVTTGPAGGAGAEPGVHGAARAGGTTVLTTRSMDGPGVAATVLREREGGPPAQVAGIASLAERPRLPALRVELLRAGDRELRTALVLPSWHEPGSGRLPVLMDPYGGPHGQRVLAAADAYLTSQWLADQGFAVIVADGRGTPGRGLAWERAVAGDLAGPPLEDQVDALAAVARHRAAQGDLDLDRVAIRGWSFGGYLAALAVLRRPDVFRAAIAGAPVTDWRLYDTHYTERYLGHPEREPAAYERSSLLADAARLSRPLLLIHGLADDNVVVAHTLRLSSALLAAGRPHQVLPLTGVTHMASQEEVAENLLLLQVEFLRAALGAAPRPARGGPL